MALKDHRPTAAAGDDNLLDSMDPNALLKLRHEIDQILGIVDLASLNIEQEIITQLQTAKTLQASVINDSTVPANQRAQTVNTVSNVLISLVKTQTDLYNAERIKEIEAAIIQAAKGLPEEAKNQFFERYERLLATQTQST
jgi:hypothetical protein